MFSKTHLLYYSVLANSWPSSQKSRFLYRIILYDVGTALFFVLTVRTTPVHTKEHHGAKPHPVRKFAHHEPLHVRAGIQPQAHREAIPGDYPRNQDFGPAGARVGEIHRNQPLQQGRPRKHRVRSPRPRRPLL